MERVHARRLSCPGVTRWVALLRGVNVGGHNRVPMRDLRAVLEGLGHSDVATYLQSGNAVLTSGETDPVRLAGAIEGGIAAHLGLTIAVLVRTRDELAAVAADNPFLAAGADPAHLHAVFLSGDPDPERLAPLQDGRYAPEELRAGERVLYLHLPNGMGRSQLAVDLGKVRTVPGVTATVRNWRTVTNVLALADTRP